MIEEFFQQAAGEVRAIDVAHHRPFLLEVFMVLHGNRQYHGEPIALEPNELGLVVRHQLYRVCSIIFNCLIYFISSILIGGSALCYFIKKMQWRSSPLFCQKRSLPKNLSAP